MRLVPAPCAGAFDIDIIGLNCATGPRMNDSVLTWTHSTNICPFCQRRAAQNVGTATRSAPENGDYKRFITEYGLHVADAATTPKHWKAGLTCASLSRAPHTTWARLPAYTTVPLESTVAIWWPKREHHPR